MNSQKSLYFLGDCSFKTLNNKNPFRIIENELKDNFVVCNFETSIYEKNYVNENKFIQLGIKEDEIPEHSIENIDIFNLANNHTFDYAEKGLKQTINFLKENNKQIIGIKNFEYLITEVNDKLIGFVGCIAYSGLKRKIYVNDKYAINIIKSIRNKCDYIILCVHWGTEYADYPSPSQRWLAKRFVKAGSDLIIGHHPHVIQGYEEISNKLVYYSLGNCNFFYRENLSKWSKFSLILEISLQDKLMIKENYYKIDDTYSLCELDKAETKEVFNHFFSISNENLKRSWIQWGKSVAPIFLKQERDTFRNRFKRKKIRQYIIFIYWLTRPKTIFLLVCYFFCLIGKNCNE